MRIELEKGDWTLTEDKDITFIDGVGCTVSGVTKKKLEADTSHLKYDPIHAEKTYKERIVRTSLEPAESIVTFTSDSDADEVREFCYNEGRLLQTAIIKGQWSEFCGLMIQTGFVDAFTKIMCLALNRSLSEMRDDANCVKQFLDLRRACEMYKWIAEKAVTLPIPDIILGWEKKTVAERFGDIMMGFGAFNGWCAWVSGDSNSGRIWNSSKSMKAMERLKKILGGMYEHTIMQYAWKSCVLFEGFCTYIFEPAWKTHCNKPKRKVNNSRFSHVDTETITAFEDKGWKRQ